MTEYILDDQNKPVKSDKAWEWMQEHWHRKIVGLTRFPNGPRVSTVFLTLDHGWDGGTPILWETMVFDTEPDGEFSDYQERYTSHEEAVAGHIAIVASILKSEQKDTIMVTVTSPPTAQVPYLQGDSQ